MNAITTRRPRRWWPWLLLVLFAALVFAAWTAATSLIDLARWQVWVDGEPWWAWPSIDGAQAVLLLVGVGALLVLLLVMVPLLVVLGVGLALGAVLLAVAVAGAVLLSPLWLLVLLLWLVLKPRRPAARMSP